MVCLACLLAQSAHAQTYPWDVSPYVEPAEPSREDEIIANVPARCPNRDNVSVERDGKEINIDVVAMENCLAVGAFYYKIPLGRLSSGNYHLRVFYSLRNHASRNSGPLLLFSVR
jgi:hypothetical protein